MVSAHDQISILESVHSEFQNGLIRDSDHAQKEFEYAVFAYSEMLKADPSELTPVLRDCAERLFAAIAFESKALLSVQGCGACGNANIVTAGDAIRILESIVSSEAHCMQHGLANNAFGRIKKQWSELAPGLQDYARQLYIHINLRIASCNNSPDGKLHLCPQCIKFNHAGIL